MSPRTRTTTPAAPHHRWASLTEAADYAGVSVKTIRRRIADGLIPAHKIGPRLVRVDLADVDAAFRAIRTATPDDLAAAGGYR